MLHTCVVGIDVMRNLEKFLDFGGKVYISTPNNKETKFLTPYFLVYFS